MLKAQGYSTRMVGKWHLGFELVAASGRRPAIDLSKPLVGGPLDHGFDTFLGMNSAMSSGPYYYIRNRGPEVLPTESTRGTKARSSKARDGDHRESYAAGDLAPGFVHEEVNSRLCDKVIGIIRNHSAKDDLEPLFLYYAMLEPHTPWLPEEQFAGKSGAGPYGNDVAQLDHEVGRVLEALKESGMENDTLVFFSSDNGALWPQADIEKYEHRANGPLAGGKARPQEGGHRVPFIARWPGRIPAGAKTGALINHTDMLATFAELLDVKDLDVETRIDSYSFFPVLREPDVQHQRPAMAVTERSFREGEWKLTFNRGRRSAGPDESDVDQASLYNLADDRGETRDLSQSQPERKQQLFAAYREYFADLKLKPLAIQVAEKKKNAKTQTKAAPARRAGTRPKTPNDQPDVNLSREQQKKVRCVEKGIRSTPCGAVEATGQSAHERTEAGQRRSKEKGASRRQKRSETANRYGRGSRIDAHSTKTVHRTARDDQATDPSTSREPGKARAVTTMAQTPKLFAPLMIHSNLLAAHRRKNASRGLVFGFQ